MVATLTDTVDAAFTDTETVKGCMRGKSLFDCFDINYIKMNPGGPVCYKMIDNLTYNSRVEKEY